MTSSFNLELLDRKQYRKGRKEKYIEKIWFCVILITIVWKIKIYNNRKFLDAKTDHEN